MSKKAKPFEDVIGKSFVIVNLWYDTNEKHIEEGKSFRLKMQSIMKLMKKDC